MQPGIFSRTYPLRQIGPTLAAIQADGFRAVQLNLLNFGMESLPASLDQAALKQGKAEAARLGLTLAALSGTYNMAHPDGAVRQAARPGFLNVLSAARVLGVKVVTLCTGSRDGANMWAEHPGNASAEAWADMSAELLWALEQAARAGVALAIEPEPGNVVRDAQAARRILDQMRAPHLKIVLDAANLIGPAGLARQAGIVAEAVDLLGAEIILAHAKDIDAAGKVVAPGRGAIDLAGFARALAGAGFDGALIGHGFEASDSRAAALALQALCAA